MSMLTSQCDELRIRAKELVKCADDLNVPYVLPESKQLMGVTARLAATEMEHAADTILSLRERLQAEAFGECELVETDSYSNANEVIHVLECSECGETCEHVNGSYPRCPHCGRAVWGRR